MMTNDSIGIPDLGLYTVGYILFSLILIFPPTEVISAGLTFDRVFSFVSGDEFLNFVEYHVRRSCLMIFMHSCIPLGYFGFLEMIHSGPTIFSRVMELPLMWKFGLLSSVGLPCAVMGLIAYWHQSDWLAHPTVKTLRLYSADWRAVASTINAEYRRQNKFAVALGGIRQGIKHNLDEHMYKLELSQQADVKLTVIRSDEHAISHLSDSQVQFLNIQVENTAKPLINPFVLRLNALNYRDLKAKLQQPITAARDVMVKESLDERFVEAFVELAHTNPRYYLTTTDRQRLDLCLGCSMEISNVKLEKNCLDSPEVERDEEGRNIPNCSQCFCRPMWCVACMGRWFAARQDAHRPDRWLSGKSPCPTCRTTFCMLDVSLVE